MPTNDYDVLIIGSGAAGGTAAWSLTKQGASCLMLDAGPLVNLERVRSPKAVYDLPYRGFGKPGRLPHVTQASEFNANQWADEVENPYTHREDAPYNWVRVRMVGGKSLFWGRMSFRLSDYEFRAKDHDGFGENWPIRYAELAPFYDRVESILRVTGIKEGLPQLPDGNFIDDKSGWSGSMQRMVTASDKHGLRLTKVRRALGQGQFASPFNLLVPEALDTGKLDIIPNAVVRNVTTDPKTGLANGVNFLDRRSGRELSAKARVVIVAASALESTRILLNSKIANSSGTLGRYLFDQFYVKQCVHALVPEAKNGKAKRGLMGGGGYIPRFTNLKKGNEDGFLRGYAIEMSTGGTPGLQFLPGYGTALQNRQEECRGAGVSAVVMGEVLPRYENYVSIDTKVVDAWGIPALHIQHKYGDNEMKMAAHGTATFAQICRDSGFEVLTEHSQPVPPGESIHELGTCRMGENPKTSVLNKWNQSHDIRNLFVVDGSCFVTGGSQNPTLTIMALTLRASEYIAQQVKAKSL